jgi:hypothetical protein
MNTEGTSEKRKSFRTLGVGGLASQPTLVIRHCEERYYLKAVGSKVSNKSKRNKRRGNLPSLVKNKEVFSISTKITSLQSRRREIASGIQQRIAEFIWTAHLSEPRNDEEWCEGRLVRRSPSKYRNEKVIL